MSSSQRGSRRPLRDPAGNPPSFGLIDRPGIRNSQALIRLFPYQIQGGGWLAAKGQLLPISQWQVLFTLLGSQFGGNGVNNFALPDYRPVAPNGSAYYVCVSGVYP